MICAAVALLSLFGAASAANEPKNGNVISAFTYYLGKEMYSFNLVAVDYVSQKPTFLQEYLPSGAKAARSFNSFTAFDEKTRSMYTVAVDFPTVAQCVFWKSTISATSDSASPVLSNVQIDYPVSRSPSPMDVAHLELARIFVGPNSRLFAAFTNGEIHLVDLEAKTFTFLYSLISDELQLGVTHPHLTWGHVFDAESNKLWSVIYAANQAYHTSSDLDAKTMAPWTLMAMPKGSNSGFAPQTVINMHMTKVDNGPAKVMVIMESLDNVGFDQISFLDTTTGQLDCKECNLMDADIVFECQMGINTCDLWRVSAWDPVYKRLYYQAHTNEGDTVMATTGFDTAINGALTWWTNKSANPMPFGLSGFQWVPFV
jgi:hypothetical protein